jgi:hypothetical protein
MLPADSPLSCRFRLSVENKEELEARGRVVRSDRNADELELVFPFRIAIEFDANTPDIEELLKDAQSRLRETP